MSACPQCGTPANDGAKFCVACGALFAPAPTGYTAGPGPAPGHGAGGGGAASPTRQPSRPVYTPPPAPPQVTRCQLGHEIAPGQSYCAMGHPIALDAMQFTGDLYAAQQPQYAPPPPFPGGPPPLPPLQAPPGAPGGYGGNPQAGYAPMTGQPGMGAMPGMQPGGAYPSAPSPPAGAYAPQRPPSHHPGPPGYEPSPGYPAPAPGQLPPNALRGFLVSYQLNPAGDFWPLRGGRMTVGRVSANDHLDIPLADATISSRHATLTIDGTSGSIVVEDTGSTNGTYVNDEHLGFNGRRELRDGDILRFGGFQTLVKIVGRA